MIKTKKTQQSNSIQSNFQRVPQFLAVALGLAAFVGFNPKVQSAETFSRTNHTSISINDYGTNYSTATPYPSTITVSGLTQEVAHVSVTLWGFTHTDCTDVSLLLVGPQGQSVVLMSQAGEDQSIAVNWLTFDDSATVSLPWIGKFWTITNGVYKPTDAQAPNYNFFPPPAPGTNSSFYSTALSAFSGTVPNGTWSLYVQNEFSQSPADSGTIAGGWTLNLTDAPFYDGVNLTDTNQLAADWDGDGVPNVLEYALGTDPKNPTDGSAGAAPTIAQASGNSYLELNYKQRVDAATLQIQYIPEVSSDKTNWFADNSHVAQVNLTPIDTEFNSVTVRDLTPISSSAAQFIRLRVVYNSISSAFPVWIGSDTTIQGNGGGGSKLTLFSQRQVRSIAYAGKVSSVQGASLTDTNSLWSEGQFGTNGIPSYVEFDNGWISDIAYSSATSNTLLVADNLAAIASPGDNYRIRPHFTISSLLGTNNEVGLIAGANPAKADNVLIWLPEAQQMLTLFYYSNPPITFQGWVRADTFQPDTNEIIYPEEGVMVIRTVASDANLFLSGPVKAGVTVAPVQPGYNFLGTLKSITSLSLSNLNLFTTNNATGVVGGKNPSVSDNLITVSSNGSVTTYFYYYDPLGFQGWVNAAGFIPSGNVLIPPGSVFLILRQFGGAFPWFIPAE